MARVRLSKRMEARYRDVAARMVSEFAYAERDGSPLVEVAAKCRAMVEAAGPFIPSLSWDLHTRLDTLRDVAIRKSVWALYLDGERLTDERRYGAGAATAGNGLSHEEYARLEGRHEWPNGNGFYSNDPPSKL